LLDFFEKALKGRAVEVATGIGGIIIGVAAKPSNPVRPDS